MGGRPKGDPTAFEVGARVRYKPGVGTYGYEDDLEADGRIRGEVVGHTPTRVRVRLVLPSRLCKTLTKAVDAASLQHAEGGAVS